MVIEKNRNKKYKNEEAAVVEVIIIPFNGRLSIFRCLDNIFMFDSYYFVCICITCRIKRDSVHPLEFPLSLNFLFCLLTKIGRLTESTN